MSSSTNPAGGGDEAAGDGGLGMQGGGGRAADDGNGEWSPGVSSTPSHRSRSTTHLSATVVNLLSPLIAVAKIGGCHDIQSDPFGLHRYSCGCMQDSRKRIGE